MKPRRRGVVRAGVRLATVVLVAAAGAQASIPPTPIRAVLTRTATGSELRASLRAFASEHEASDRATAGEAWTRIGQSFELEGTADSAIVAFRRAAELRGDPEDHLALGAALLRRRRAGDAAEALRDLAPLGPGSEGQLPAVALRLRATLGWAELEAGHADSAMTWFEDAGEGLLASTEWRLRWGRAALAAGDGARARTLLLLVAVRARGQDPEVTGLLASAGIGSVAATVATNDRREAGGLAPWGARHLELRAGDGSVLGAILLSPARPHGPPLVVIVAPGDTMADYDSLAVGLRNAGRAVLLLEPRGSGHSISAAWPRIDSWAGRQEELARLTALDLHAAARALAQTARADTSRIVLGGVGASASLAIRVAARSPRVAALLLVSPTPRPAEWAPLRAVLAARRIPAFFQLALEEHWSTWDESDVLYQAGNTGDSRVVESRGGGHGAAQFQHDEELMPRLSRWLDGLPAGRVPASGPRRSAPPKR